MGNSQDWPSGGGSREAGGRRTGTWQGLDLYSTWAESSPPPSSRPGSVLVKREEESWSSFFEAARVPLTCPHSGGYSRLSRKDLLPDHQPPGAWRYTDVGYKCLALNTLDITRCVECGPVTHYNASNLAEISPLSKVNIFYFFRKKFQFVCFSLFAS